MRSCAQAARAKSAALGIASGLTGQTVANIEVKGMMSRVDTVERVLGVTAGWLVFG